MRQQQNRRLVSGLTIALLIATSGSLATPQSAFAQWEYNCAYFEYVCWNYCVNACQGQGGQCAGVYADCWWNICEYACYWPNGPCCDWSCWFDPYCDCHGNPPCYN